MARAQRKNNVAGKINTFTNLLLPIWSLVIHRNHTEPKVPLTNFSRISTKITGLYPSSSPSMLQSWSLVFRDAALLPCQWSVCKATNKLSPPFKPSHIRASARVNACMMCIALVFWRPSMMNLLAVSCVTLSAQLFSHFQGQIFWSVLLCEGDWISCWCHHLLQSPIFHCCAIENRAKLSGLSELFLKKNH